jgi:hypothetical protein
MPFEQLHIFLIINLCIQAPDMELKALDCVFPCCMYGQNFTVRSKSDRTDQFLLHCTTSRLRKTDCPNPRIVQINYNLPIALSRLSTKRTIVAANLFLVSPTTILPPAAVDDDDDVSHIVSQQHG